MDPRYSIFGSHFGTTGGQFDLDPKSGLFVNTAQAQPPQQTQTGKKKPNFLQSLFPSIGGLAGGVGGGALGGALAGSAILPGVGTAAGGLIGALLGGAAGGAAGKVAENSALGEGLGHDVLKEAGIQGVLSAGPIRLLKGAATGGRALVAGGDALAANEAAQGGGRLLNALNAAGEKAAAPGLLSRTASKASGNLQADASGVGKVANSFTQEGDILGTLNRRGMRGSGTKLYQNVDSELGNISNEIQGKLGTITTTAPRAEVLDTLSKNVADLVPADTSYTKELTRSVQRLSKGGSETVGPQELFSFKQSLGKQLGNAFKKLERGAPLTAKEEVDMALWKQLDGEITKLAPDVKALTLDQSNLISARPGFKAASQKTAGIPLLGVKSKTAERGLQAGRDVASRALGRVSGEVNPYGVGQVAKRVLPVGLLGALAGSATQGADQISNNPMSDSMSQIDNSAMSANSIDQASGLSGDLSSEGVDNSAASPFDTANVDQNVQNIISHGGKLSDVAQYLDLVGALQKIKAPPSAGKLNATQIQQANNAQSGLDAISTIVGELGKNPNVLLKSAVPTNVGKNLAGGARLDTARKEVADVIARLRTGAAINDKEEKLYLSKLPQYGDTPQQAQYKLQSLARLLQQFAQPTAGAVPDVASEYGSLYQ